MQICRVVLSKIPVPNMEQDPFDGLLELEEKFYNEGHSLGVEEGRRAGFIEGRFFGLEKGFEKYAAMGRLHGRSVLWAGRLPPLTEKRQPGNLSREEASDVERKDQTLMPSKVDFIQDSTEEATVEGVQTQDAPSILSLLPENPRLEKHIRTLYALVEPSSLATTNSEDSVSDFDDRFRRAEGKVRIIEKLIGEGNYDVMFDRPASSDTGRGASQQLKAGDGGIEDISVLGARH